MVCIFLGSTEPSALQLLGGNLCLAIRAQSLQLALRTSVSLLPKVVAMECVRGSSFDVWPNMMSALAARSITMTFAWPCCALQLLDGNLSLAIGAQSLQLAILARICEFIAQGRCRGVCDGHPIRRMARYDALVTGSNTCRLCTHAHPLQCLGSAC